MIARNHLQQTIGIALCLLTLPALPAMAESLSGRQATLSLSVEGKEVQARLSSPGMMGDFAVGPYVWKAMIDGADCNGLTSVQVKLPGNQTLLLTGKLGPLEVEQRFTLLENSNGFAEAISLRNPTGKDIAIDDIRAGFSRQLTPATDPYRLVAVPYRRQADGSMQDYSMSSMVALIQGGGKINPTCEPAWSPCAPLVDEQQRRLRSESWILTDGTNSLLVLKYNNKAVEHSAVNWIADSNRLVFGGCAFVLHREPVQANRIKPGETFCFGATRYEFYRGGWPEGYSIYKAFMNSQGHGLTADYNPQVQWEILFDLGDRRWPRAGVLDQAALAKAVGCSRIYFDPGWQVPVSDTNADPLLGSALWDEKRLGPVADMVSLMKNSYGLELGLWTASRVGNDGQWPQEYYRQAASLQSLNELCMSDVRWRDERFRRLSKLADAGVKFLMFDFHGWNGPCYAADHGHPVPSTTIDHIASIYGVARKLRQQHPDLRIEMHDGVWPWGCRYLPSYFHQGLQGGDYDENWAYEFMWNSIGDIRSGKAMCLYYYNLAYDLPMYLHFNMHADNDHCLAFWWMASTVRHIGFGGRTHAAHMEPHGPLAVLTPEQQQKRFDQYKEAMIVYNRLKRYFTHGQFIGIGGDETLQLHTLPDRPGGVLMVFNLSDKPATRTVRVPLDKLNLKPPVLPAVTGAAASLAGNELLLQVELGPESPAIIEIGTNSAPAPEGAGR